MLGALVPVISNMPSGEGNWLYLQVQFDGTNLIYSYSLTGFPGTFHQLYTQTASSWLGGSPTNIALVANSGTNGGAGDVVLLICDWFRRIS